MPETEAHVLWQALQFEGLIWLITAALLAGFVRGFFRLWVRIDFHAVSGSVFATPLVRYGPCCNGYFWSCPQPAARLP